MNIRIQIIFCFCLLLPLNSDSQNRSIDIVFDSIYPLIRNGEYEEAKSIWVDTEKDFPMDQQEKYLFLLTALRNQDVSFYKKEMRRLVKEGGYYLSIFDTLAEYGNYNVALFRETGVLEWTVKLCEKHYPKWIQDNPKSYYVRQRSEYFIERDQNFIKLAFPLCDSSDSCIKLRDEHYEQFAMISASELASFFNEIGGVANNIDYGVQVYYPLLIVIHHIMESSEKSMNYAWGLLKPHFEKARLEGKIGRDIFFIYDEALYSHTGVQYYGMYGDVPVKDQENLASRQVKFNLIPYDLAP